jgi:hypothetical protein
MMSDPNQEYDLRRCRCGVRQHTSLCSRHAFIEMPHIARQRERQREYDARHRPASPVDKAWPPRPAPPNCGTARRATSRGRDDATKARREVAGGAPTREWRDGRAGSGAMNGGLSDK